MCVGSNTLNNEYQFEEAKIFVRTYKETQASRDRSFVETNIGTSATLTAFCSGSPLPTEGVWKKNGVQVTPAATISITNTPQYDPDFKLTSDLTFSSPTAGDIAAYACECTNSYQDQTFTDETTLELRVVTKVSIQRDANNPTSAEYGKPVSLSCIATGLPIPASVVWSRNLVSSDKYETIQPNSGRFTVETSEMDISNLRSTLTISTTEYGDDGTYMCYADNKINDVVHSAETEGTLLIYQNPTVVMASSEVAANANDNKVLSCTVSSKPAPSKMEWYFGDSKIANQPTSTSSGFDRSSQYTVSSVSSTTEGKYRCIGYHSYNGETATGEGYTYVRLHRPYAVTSSTSPSNAETVNEYTALSLICTATGVPQVTEFKWTVESVLLDSDAVTSDVGEVVTVNNYGLESLNIQVDSTLVMERVKYTNLGKYKCETSQVWDGTTDTTTKEFDIVVNFDAKILSGTGSTDIYQNVGSQIRLTCHAYGNPEPDDITWKWNLSGNEITDSTDFKIVSSKMNTYKKESILQFRFLPIYHKVDIQCLTKNTLSASDQKLLFTLNMNPNTMSIIESGSRNDGSSLTLTCLTTFSEGSISWLKDGVTLEANSRISYSTNTTYSTKNSVLEISEVDKTADTGNYTCQIIGDITLATEYQLTLTDAVVDGTTGLSTGIIVALIVLVVFIVIVVILIVVVFAHGKRRKGLVDKESVAESYENRGYREDNLQSVISMPDTAFDNNLPKIVEPIVLTKNEPDHPVMEATIMQQATLTQQRKRNPNLGKAQTLDRPSSKDQPPRRSEPAQYTLDHRAKRDWY